MILLLLRHILKIRNTISKNILQVALGLLVGVFVISQTVYVKPAPSEDKQEKSENEAPENAQIVTSEAVTVTSLQINLGFQSYLLGEVVQTQSDQRKSFYYNHLLPSFSKAFKVLFNRIVAPNAP
jgi:predicted histidine transporter YuiF (NhaC family)